MKKLAAVTLSAMILLATACTQYIYVPGDIFWDNDGASVTRVSTLPELIEALSSAENEDRIKMNISTNDNETPSSLFPIIITNDVTLEGNFEYKSASTGHVLSMAYDAKTSSTENAGAGLILFKVADTASVNVKSLTVTLDDTTANKVDSVISIDRGKLNADNYNVVVSGTTTAPAAITLGKNATEETLIIKNSENTQIVIDENNEHKDVISAGLPTDVTTPNDVATYEEFYNELTKSGTVRLTEDINETSDTAFTFPAGHDLYAINLNGHTLSIAAPGSIMVPADSELSLRNGTINLTMTNQAATTKANLFAEDNATITIDHVTYTGSHSTIYPNSNRVTVRITDSTVTAKGAYGVGTNASQPVVQGENIYITRSTVQAIEANGDCTGVMINVPGTLEITDSTISGGRQGVIVRGGTATITGSTIESTGKYNGTPSFTGEEKYWGSGNEVAFAALCVGSYSTSAYDYPSIVTVTDTDIILGKTDRTDASRIAVGCAIAANTVTLNLDKQADVDEANAHISVTEALKDNITINLSNK